MQKPKPPTDAEREDSIRRQLSWQTEYRGLDREGLDERAKQLAHMKPPAPRFTPMPDAKPPRSPRK